MKKHFLIIIILFSNIHLFSQVYIEPTLGFFHAISPYDTDPETSQSLKFRFGQGANMNMGIGFQTEMNLIFEMGFNNQFKNEISTNIRKSRSITNIRFGLDDLSGEINYFSKSHYYYFLVGYKIEKGLYSFSFKTGLNLLSSKFQIINNETETQMFHFLEKTYQYHYNAEIENKLSPGFIFQAKGSYQLKPKIALSFLIQTSLNVTEIKTKTETEIRPVSDGSIFLPPDYTFDTFFDDDFRSNFSRLGFQIGMTFYLGKLKNPL